LSASAIQLIAEWKQHASDVEPQSLVFSTKKGNALSPNNVVRRAIFPTCDQFGIPRATWLTFRRTYSSWSHAHGVPGKVIAELMGHTNVDVTLNVHTQVLDGSLRAAVDKVGDGLFTIVHQPEVAGSLTH
jgi:integrase